MARESPGMVPEAWRSYLNVNEARIAAAAALRDMRVLGIAIVEDGNPLRFVEWIDASHQSRSSRLKIGGSALTLSSGGLSTELTPDLWVRIADNSPDGILICDPRGTIRYWNRGAERIFGFVHAEVDGASLDLIIPEQLRARHWAGWRAAMTTGKTKYAEGQLLAVPAVHAEGRRISIEFSIQLLTDSNSEVEWVVAVIRDVTERFNREKALRAELNARRS